MSAEKVVAEMSSYQKAEQARQAEQLEREKASYRLQSLAQEQVAREAVWQRPGSWTDQEYRQIIAEMPARPGSK
jgi:hypothetical protein